MKKLIIAILLTMGIGTAYADLNPQSDQKKTPDFQVEVYKVPTYLECVKPDDLKRILDAGGLSPIFGATTADGKTVMVLTNTQNHFWAVTVFYKNSQIGCIVGIGNSFTSGQSPPSFPEVPDGKI